MNSARRVTERTIAGKAIYICDGFVDEDLVCDFATILRALHYTRSETSREGAPVSGSSAEVPASLIESHDLFKILQTLKERFFPGKPSHQERVHVNFTVYGDMYYPHRDCPVNEPDVTVLYYANPTWSKDWGGETVFYNEDEDAEFAVSPRPGRIAVFSGAILHKGGVPSRSCYEDRLTLAYKFSNGGRIQSSHAENSG